jgi:LPXTG-site transpeptidase (sortase) family protein
MIVRVHIGVEVRSRRWLRLLADALIAFGAAGVLLFFATKAEGLLYDRIDSARFAAALTQNAPAPSPPPDTDSPAEPAPELLAGMELEARAPAPAPVPGIDWLSGETRLWAALSEPWAAGAPIIAKLEIPEADVSTVVYEGIGARALRRGAGHLPGTALPGQAGNFVVAGHRDTVFGNLRFVKAGDTIRVSSPSGVFEYTVTALSVVPPTDVSAIGPTREPVSTLVTCYPFGHAGPSPRRFVVQAVQKSQD